MIKIPSPNPAFNITQEELEDLANKFIAPFFNEYPDVKYKRHINRTPHDTPNDTISFGLVPSTRENYIEIGLRKDEGYYLPGGSYFPYKFHYRKIIIMNDRNWYVNPDPNEKLPNTFENRNRKPIQVDYKIIPIIIEQLKNSYEDDSAGRFTNGLCVNGTREIDIRY